MSGGVAKRLRLHRGDTLVICVPGRLTNEAAEQMRQHMGRTFPGRKVLVFAEGIQIGVIANGTRT